ncbi:hypothetical protein ACFV6F_02635 [Kitasatospora phosalacinea]|uniref:hypothetical protein n=1 Tax=Kitasatospora phosalacinea TaxID=2065 RepID=UPI00365C51E6
MTRRRLPTALAQAAARGLSARLLAPVAHRLIRRRPSASERATAELIEFREERNRAGDSYPLW